MDKTPNAIKERLWTRNFLIILVVSLAVSLTNMMMNVTLPLYVGHIGGSTSVAGIVMGVFPIAALLARPFSGSLLDTKGRRTVLIAGAIMVVIAALMHNFAYSIIFLIIIRFIHGAGFSASTTASGTVAVDITPYSRLPEGIGYFSVANTVSTAIGPALALFLLGSSNFKTVFITSFILAVILLVGSIAIRYDEKKSLQNSNPAADSTASSLPVEPEGKDARKSSFIETSALPAASVMLLIALAIAGPVNFLAPYAQLKGIANIGIYFTVYAAAMFLTRTFSGKLSKLMGVTKSVIPGIVLIVAGMFILSQAKTLPLFLVAAVLNGLSFGITQPTLNTVVIRMCPPERRGTANATFYCAVDIGIGAGALLWGIIAQFLGYPAIFISASICGALGILAYFTILKKRMDKLGIV